MLSTDIETKILQRVLNPRRGDWSASAARELLKLGFSESDHAQMADLSAKAAKGKLTGAERQKLDGYINVSHFIAFVHSKARMSLKNHQSAA